MIFGKKCDKCGNKCKDYVIAFVQGKGDQFY